MSLSAESGLRPESFLVRVDQGRTRVRTSGLPDRDSAVSVDILHCLDVCIQLRVAVQISGTAPLQTERKTDRQTDNQTARQPDSQTARQPDSQTARHAHTQAIDIILCLDYLLPQGNHS